jgi:NAD(P)H dehydrogenase (quinone)
MVAYRNQIDYGFQNRNQSDCRWERIMTCAVTGASGNLAGLVARSLLDAVDPSEVVLVSRRPEALSHFAGADLRLGDFAAPETLPAAFAGVDTLLIVSTDAVGQRLDQQRAAIGAAADAGVGRIVYTSAPDPVDDNPALVVPDHAGTEAALRASGVRWTALRNNLYAHTQVPTVQQAIASGALVTNAGDGRTAYVTREDCAAVAAAVLVQDGHDDRAYEVTGPAAVGADDLAALAGELGGTPIKVVHVDDDAYVQGLVGAGLPEEMARVVASFGAAAREGHLDTVSTTVADVTGRPPTPLREVLGLP